MDDGFKKLTVEDIVVLQPYFSNCKFNISDYSCAFKFMWQEYYVMYYTILHGCAIFKEEYKGEVYFHYPLSLTGDEEQEKLALDDVEKYVVEREIKLNFTCVPKERMLFMIERYGINLSIINKRKWKDYLYLAEDFCTFSGKKFAGQRNHVNKFNKLYSNSTFKILGEAEEGIIYDFLKKYEERQLSKGSVMATEEMEGVYKILPYITKFKQLAGGLFVNGEMVGFAMGEKCGEQIIVHVEKALTEYEGVYPALAQRFAQTFARDDVKYLNREDDAGDSGLRKSKLQYKPIKLVDKYDLFPKRLIDDVGYLPRMPTERLTLKEITDEYARVLYKLEIDKQRNAYWGYKWWDVLDGQPTPEYFMQVIRSDFQEKREMPLGIFLKNTLIGEVVLHAFGYKNDCEVGVRLLKEYEGCGYATEAVTGAINYALFSLNADTVHAKCFKQNERSKKTLISAGMIPDGEDETFFYFKKTAVN